MKPKKTWDDGPAPDDMLPGERTDDDRILEEEGIGGPGDFLYNGDETSDGEDYSDAFE